jgi:hypothetical protein
VLQSAVAVQVQKVLQVAVQQLLFLAGAARRAVQVQKSVVAVQSLGRAAGEECRAAGAAECCLAWRCCRLCRLLSSSCCPLQVLSGVEVLSSSWSRCYQACPSAAGAAVQVLSRREVCLEKLSKLLSMLSSRLGFGADHPLMFLCAGRMGRGLGEYAEFFLIHMLST